MKRQAPTAGERKALESIKAAPTRSLLAVASLTGCVWLLQVVPERYAAASTIVAVGLILALLAVLVYQTCCLRCPRCAGWVVIPKCPSCGLKLNEPGAKHHQRSLP